MKSSKKRVRSRRLTEFPDDPATIVDPHCQVLVGVQLVPLVTFADDVRDDYSVPISDDTCCRDNPQLASAKIAAVSLSPDRASLVVEVAASHPCGIESVMVYVGDEVVDSPRPGIVRKRFVIREAGGKKIGDSALFKCADKVKSVTPKLKIPTADLVGTAAFRIAAYAYDCCQNGPSVVQSKGMYSVSE